MFLVLLAAAALVSCLVGGLTVAVVGALFLSVPFGDSWSAAWDNPLKLLLFAVLLLPALASRG